MHRYDAIPGTSFTVPPSPRWYRVGMLANYLYSSGSGDLMLLSPGAVNNGVGGDRGKTSEQGPTTIVNGTRQNFNGFLINGVSNKDLSGGPNNTPIEDSIQEFQQLTLNMSAQYGNSAGSVTNLITKAGTNNWHGSAWEFLRNDKLDARSYFDPERGELRRNQVAEIAAALG